MAPKPNRRPQHAHSGSLDVDLDAMAPALCETQTLPPRSNTDLNLAVLQSHNQAITAILSIAPYAVIYTFSAQSQAWEKSGCEGTLFVVSLKPNASAELRYAVVVLNRRGLDNFVVEVKSEDDIQITEEYIILQGESAMDNEQASHDVSAAPQLIYGLWIFSEPAPSSTAQMRELHALLIQECAQRAEASRTSMFAQAAQSPPETPQQGDYQDSHSAPMARQGSLREMLGLQRQMDSGFSIEQARVYQHISALHGPTHGHYQPQPPRQDPNILQDLFRRAAQPYPSS